MSKQFLEAPNLGATSDFVNNELGESAAYTGGLHDEMHSLMQTRFGNQLLAKNMLATSADDDAELKTGGGGGSGGSSGIGSFMSYVGDITYVRLAAGAFGHDDPLHMQDRAMRWFEENIRHKHSRDNPQAWVSMADSLMTQAHLADEGAKVKPLKLGPLNGQIKDDRKLDAQNKDSSHNAENAKAAMDKLGSQDEYVLASTYLYLEAIEKADQRAAKEAKDHKVEKRALGRMKWNSGETDLTDAVQTDHNTIDPILLELGAPVSYRLEAARFIERYGKKSNHGNDKVDYSNLVTKLRQDAQTIFDDPHALSDPVHRELLAKYGSELKDTTH